MKLLTQEEGALLKEGQVVNVYWFTPRKPKDAPEPPSREWGGRQEWVDRVWANQVVSEAPWKTSQDGFAVKLEGRGNIYLVSSLEKC